MTSENDIETEIAHLRDLDLSGLRGIRYSAARPPTICPAICILAYRLQANLEAGKWVKVRGHFCPPLLRRPAHSV
jgi:hypothetical protein